MGSVRGFNEGLETSRGVCNCDRELYEALQWGDGIGLSMGFLHT